MEKSKNMESLPILIIDFNNMVHRARAGFSKGENPITYTFFLMLRKTVERFTPSRIYIVKEGRPQRRHDAFGEYKANRSSAGDDFWRQHRDIVSILTSMPVEIVRHPQRECDDTIAHLVKVVHKSDPCVIVSTDTDFIQLLSDDQRIRLWNPTKEVWVSNFACDYVKWKSLVGDGSDNIPGFKGIGGKTAEKLLNDQSKLDLFLNENGRREQFERNLFLIAFHEIEDDIERTDVKPDWSITKAAFIERGFWSIANDKSWEKYMKSFSTISQ